MSPNIGEKVVRKFINKDDNIIVGNHKLEDVNFIVG